MKEIIPYNKEVHFDKSVSSIESISLEVEKEIADSDIEGEFIVSGEYKSHELSANKEPFNFKLPFSLTISDNIDISTINLTITDFNYELKESNILAVDIIFSVSAKEKEDIIKTQNDEFEKLATACETISEDRVEPVNIINTVKKEDSYVKYIIHYVSEEDTIESICLKYNVTKEDLEEYNDLSLFVPGLKILILKNE